jgi:hypothetical protein
MNTQTPHDAPMRVPIDPNDSSDEPVALKTVASAPTNALKPKKRKKVVDPNAPKRALSAFVLFSQAERVAIKRDQPDTPNSAMLKLLGERWKAADADTKAKYVAMHAENKAEADEARRVYAADTKDDSDAESVSAQAPVPKKRKKVVDPNAPKRALSAFILFSQAERVAIKRDQPDTPNSVMLKLLGERWKAADADTKAKYVAMHAENKADADEARRVHAADTKNDSDAESADTTHTPKPTTRKKVVDSNAPKRALSAFVLFSQAERVVIKRDQPDTPNSAMLKLLGERWKAADADTKAKYAAMHAENKAEADEARRVYAAHTGRAPA